MLINSRLDCRSFKNIIILHILNVSNTNETHNLGQCLFFKVYFLNLLLIKFGSNNAILLSYKLYEIYNKLHKKE